MTDEECIIKITREISGFEYEEDDNGLYDTIDRVREIIEEWKHGKDDCKVAGIEIRVQRQNKEI